MIKKTFFSNCREPHLLLLAKNCMTSSKKKISLEMTLLTLLKLDQIPVKLKCQIKCRHRFTNLADAAILY